MVDHLDVEGLPKDIPEFVEVDLSAIDMNESFHLSSVTPPKGCAWTADLEMNLVSCHAPKIVAESTEVVEPEMVGEEEAPADEEVKEAS
jgi:large subunit ribosomal protein L25